MVREIAELKAAMEKHVSEIYADGREALKLAWLKGHDFAMAKAREQVTAMLDHIEKGIERRIERLGDLSEYAGPAGFRYCQYPLCEKCSHRHDGEPAVRYEDLRG
jgi:hypothetical protein